MVWGAISYDSRSPLVRIRGTLTSRRYVDEVLQPVVLPYLQQLQDSIFQQDNATSHTALVSRHALQNIQLLPWPAMSPDLSPIEHIWDGIGRRLSVMPQPPSEDELWRMVQTIWASIPQDTVRTLIDSLPRRVSACIAARGGHTTY